MNKWVKPTILVSKCLGFDHCRYDGSMISSSFVEKIKPFVDFVPVCPEVEIGLGVPRKSLRLVQDKKQKRIVQTATSKDVTEDMNSFVQLFLSKQSNIHGAILKSRSPSCGIKDVKLYAAIKNAAPVKRTSGIFGEIVQNTLPIIVESEGRLRNSFIQEHFLASIFTFADFKQIKEKTHMKDLVSFHTKNKFLFMAYNQEILQEMGRIVANQKGEDITRIVEDYEQCLYSIFSIPPSHKSTINVLLHLFGFVSKELSVAEKSFFLELIENYKKEKIPLNVLSHVLRSWVVRFADPYLSKQTFFMPFPNELLDEDLSVIADKQRYWK